MHSQEFIDALVNRIGWSDLTSDLPIDLSDDNKSSDSNKTFDSFHQMVSLENIYATIPEKFLGENGEEYFNQYLLNLKKQAVYSILTSILDTHKDYDSTKDYSIFLTERPSLFDNAIGYSVAVKVLEMFISSSRSNLEERNVKLSYQSLKIELEGARNENGHLIAKGLVYKLEKSIKDTQKVIFPFKVVVENGNCW